MSINKIKDYLNHLKLTKTEAMIAELILKEIDQRLQFLMDVGLEYLTLSRNAGSLSGGEAQRIRLATQIGSRTNRSTLYFRRAKHWFAPKR